MAARPKSDLHRYLDNLILSQRIQSVKRPEEWLWLPAAWAVGTTVATPNWPSGVGIYLACQIAIWTLRRLRFGPQSAAQFYRQRARERAPERVQRLLRKGELEASLGREAVVALERCAELTNGITAEIASEFLLSAGSRGVPKITRDPERRRLIRSTEVLMLEALGAVANDLLLRRKPGPEAFAALWEVEVGLTTLNREARRRVTTGPARGLPTSVVDHLEELRLRADAECELDAED